MCSVPAAGSGEPVATAPEPEVETDTPRQKAMTVEEFTERKGQKASKGLLGRLRGGREEADEAPVAGGGNLSVEDRRNLQTTLYELLECKRLLDQVRSD